MKFIISFLLIILLSFAVCLYFSWWSIALVAFVVAAVIPQRPLISFITGFLSLFLLWAVLSFWISMNNGNILAHKISLIIIKTDSPILLMIVSALIGALVAGFAATAGSYFRSLFYQPRNK